MQEHLSQGDSCCCPNVQLGPVDRKVCSSWDNDNVGDGDDEQGDGIDDWKGRVKWKSGACAALIRP